MKIRIITISHKAPAWLQEGYQEYAKRIPYLELVEIEAEKRTENSNIEKIREREATKLLAQCKTGEFIIALDVKGKSWSTEQLANQLKTWLQNGANVNLIIGGPDGLSKQLLSKANLIWSISTLTFPHLFIRLILAEQLYRAYSILQHHPYHR